jgi:hypothetical protein
MMNFGDGESQMVEFSPAFPNQGAFFLRTYHKDYARVKNQTAPSRMTSTMITTTASVVRLDFVAGCSDWNIFSPFWGGMGGIDTIRFLAAPHMRSENGPTAARNFHRGQSDTPEMLAKTRS